MYAVSGNCALLGLTGHYVNFETCKQESVILAAVPLVEAHTADYLRQCLFEQFQKWEIESKLHIILRDNARNMEKAMRDGGWSDFPCFNHTLALVVKDGLEVQQHFH